MRWVIVIAMLAAVSVTGSFAFAATLNVDSDHVTVDHNTLHSPALNFTLSSPSITVGEAAHGSATFTGDLLSPNGTVKYAVYSNNGCTTEYSSAGTMTVANAVVPDSDSVTFTAAGTYYWRATYSGDGNHQPASSSCTAITVNKKTPTMTTSASGPVTVGSGTITDTATLSGGYNMGGSVSFSVFAPGDTICATPLAPPPTSATVIGDDDYTSGAFTPAAAGTYRWIASYSGDANNNAVSGNCDVANASIVDKATPAMSTSALLLDGDTITYTATLGGGYGTLTGSVSFSIYASDDTGCATPLAPSPMSATVIVGSSYSRTLEITAAGSYRWSATYDGDPNNVAVSSGCNAPPSP